jgi:methylisocitrate lyase
MLYSTTAPATKRAQLRAALASGELQRFPGAFNPLSAQLIQQEGFEGVYISGAVLAADLGLPDIGLTTLTEVAGRSQQIARVTELPAIVNPKRCGHLDGKAVVGLDAAVRRIKAAVDARRDPDFLIMARTDIRAGQGLDAAVDRAKALVDAGADAIFPEAMRSLAEFAAIRHAVRVPVLANMTEFGKSELFTVTQLADVGINIAIFPVSLLRMAMGAARSALRTLAQEGSLTSRLGDMQHRSELYELIDYESYNQFDSSIFTYRP